MGQEKKLPPLRFLSQRVERPWGSVDYDLADLGFIDSVAGSGPLGGNTLSELMETYLDRITGDHVFDAWPSATTPSERPPSGMSWRRGRMPGSFWDSGGMSVRKSSTGSARREGWRIC